MTPTTRYPTSQITPAGAYELLHGRIPNMTYRSYDDTSVFELMGGASIPDPTIPESIRLLELKGLVPPWKPIEQKGATQDGSTFVTALYEPCDIDLVVQAKGRDPQYTRQLIRDWIAAWDAKKPGELSFFTPEMGRWWTSVRWSRNPVDKILGGTFTQQQFTWAARAYDAFWRSYDSVAQFGFSYNSVIDLFNFTTTTELGANWTVAYAGAGTGTVRADGSQVVSTLANGKAAICRRNSYTTTTDNQVVEILIGKFATSWWHPTNAYVDVWLRMANTGTPGLTGVRLRLGHSILKLSAFNSGAETVLRQQNMTIPSQTNTKIMVVAGFEGAGNERVFKVLRNGASIMTVRENGTTSAMGADYRSVGFGVYAAGTSVPPTVRDWAAGVNETVAQTGFVELQNTGDQDMWPRYTCIGPGTFRFGNGPGSTDYVQFGPLLTNQIMQVRSEPAKRGVVDLTAIPPTPQELTIWQKALQDFLSFATGNNVPPLLQEIESLFGIHPPQGNPYSLLSGRFSVPIPPKPAGAPAVTSHIAVAIDDGNADSKIIAAGTPLRRFPW